MISTLRLLRGGFIPGVPTGHLHRVCGDDYDWGFPIDEGSSCSEEYIEQLYTEAEYLENINFFRSRIGIWKVDDYPPYESFTGLFLRVIIYLNGPKRPS